MTPKQEAFARAYVETGNASEAYRSSYCAEKMSDQVIWNEASKLLQHHEVAVRVQQIQLAAQKRTEITVEKLTQMAMKAYDEAQRVAPNSGQMQTSAMVKATEFIGKLHGLLVDKSEVKHVSGVEDLNDDELANLARSGRGGTASETPRPSRAN
jgi:tRNA A-37 threonylcarbamoyl transferase component Bud32